MTTEIVTLNVPVSLAQELRTASQQFLVEIIERGLKEFRIEQVLAQYSQGGISFGAAAQQAGLSQSELARYAYAQGVEPPYSNQTLLEELS